MLVLPLLLAVADGDRDDARQALLEALATGPAVVDAGVVAVEPVDALPQDAGSSTDAGVAANEGASYDLSVELLGDGVQPGDVVTLALRLRYPEALAIKLPETLPEGRGLAPLGPPERLPESDGDHIAETLKFPFVLLATSGVESPAFTIGVGDEELAIPALPMVVTDAGPSAAPPDPEPAPMVVYRPGPAPWVLPVVSLILALLIGGFLLSRWLRNRPEPEAPAPPPVDHAALFRAELARLRGELDDDPERLKAAWFALLAALRDYLDARFGLHSAQSTTEEMMAALAAARLVGFPRLGLRALLEQADAVRYAGAESSREAMGDLLDQVEVWVQTAENGAGS